MTETTPTIDRPSEGEERAMTPEQIAGHLSAALAEVRACLPGKPRTVSVGACEYSADDVREFLRRMRKAEAAVEKAYHFLNAHGIVYPAGDDRGQKQQDLFDTLNAVMRP